MRITLLSILLLGILGCCLAVPPADLPSCLTALNADVQTEGELSAQLEDLTNQLAIAKAQLPTWEWYRDDNLTVARSCLKNLTICNDANSFKSASNKRDYEKAKYFKGEVFDQEKKVINKLASMERHLAKKMKTKSSSKHTKRDVTDCTYEQCLRMHAISVNYQNQLNQSISVAQQRLTNAQDLVMAYDRYARLYGQLNQECIVVLGECNNGTRLIRGTFFNAPDNDTFNGNIVNVFFGLTPTTFIPSGSLLTAYSGGSTAELATAVTDRDGYFINSGSISLGAGDSYAGSIKVDPANAQSAFVVALYENGDVLSSSAAIFDGDGNWVSQAKRSTSKRYNWPTNDCGAVGDPIPFAPPHITGMNLNILIPGGAGPNYAYVLIEELRLYIPYPPGIPAEALAGL